MSVTDSITNSSISAALSTFDGFLPESPLWVYVASARLSGEQASEASALSDAFMSGWKSHGAPVTGTYSILDNQILLFAADVRFEAPSGCSLDSLTGHVRNLSARFNIDFFGRLSVLVWQADGHIIPLTISAFKQGISDRLYSPDTLVFDHSIHICGQLSSFSKIKAGQTWLKKYFLS